MRLPAVLFGLLIAMCVVLGLAFTIDEVPGGHGMHHPKYETMEAAPAGADRHARVLWLGWVFGILQIGVFVACLMLGVRRAGEPGVRRRAFVGGGLLYGAVFTLLIVVYRQSMQADGAALWFGLPAPTVVMFLGLWPVPLVFLGLYFVMFHRWVLTDDDVERFREIVAAQRRRERAEDAG